MSVFFIAGSSYYPSEIEELGNSFIEMDATVSLNEEFSNAISSHPVQIGADITDHVRRENNKFSVKGMISDYTPIRSVREGSFYTSAGTGNSSTIPSRAQQAYEFITKMRDNAVVFTLVTQYKSYPNCVIAKVTNDHKVENGGALELSIDIQQIRIVRTSSTILASTKENPDDSVSTKNNGTESGGDLNETSWGRWAAIQLVKSLPLSLTGDGFTVNGEPLGTTSEDVVDWITQRPSAIRDF